jgi:hypothetical protein
VNEKMELAAIIIEGFSIVSLTVVFAKYTLEKRKASQFEDDAKNPLRRF